MAGKAQAVDDRPHRKNNHHANNFLPRYDQELRGAKNDGREVRFTLALETDFCDDDFRCQGLILEVDRFNIKIGLTVERREVWVGKAFIVGTEILS